MKKMFESQQTRARKEFKALHRAQKNEVSENEIVNEMVKDMENPQSAQSLMQASAALMYMKMVKEGKTPITDATNRVLERKRKEEKEAREGFFTNLSTI